MSEKPTPQTDTVDQEFWTWCPMEPSDPDVLDWVCLASNAYSLMKDHAKGLERERDELVRKHEVLHSALADMRSGWRYIRDTYGDLYGVGWDRCEKSSAEALGICEECEYHASTGKARCDKCGREVSDE